MFPSASSSLPNALEMSLALKHKLPVYLGERCAVNGVHLALKTAKIAGRCSTTHLNRQRDRKNPSLTKPDTAPWRGTWAELFIDQATNDDDCGLTECELEVPVPDPQSPAAATANSTTAKRSARRAGARRSAPRRVTRASQSRTQGGSPSPQVEQQQQQQQQHQQLLNHQLAVVPSLTKHSSGMDLASATYAVDGAPAAKPQQKEVTFQGGEADECDDDSSEWELVDSSEVGDPGAVIYHEDGTVHLKSMLEFPPLDGAALLDEYEWVDPSEMDGDYTEVATDFALHQ